MMKINSKYIKEYEYLMKTTNVQKGYQEFLTFFKGLRSSLSQRMSGYTFTGMIVENAMDYSYFQFTDTQLKSKGLKIVIVYVHKESCYEVWLSGVNRKVQSTYHALLGSKKCTYVLSTDPKRVDYIVKDICIDDIEYEQYDKTVERIQTRIEAFIKNVKAFI